NVIDNAIKYTPAEGHVEISVEGRPVPTVTVRDDGVGIPAEHLPHVFDRFYRARTARGAGGDGTGLGLSIARMIIHAHGGQIRLASPPGQGTCCTITLPDGRSTAPPTGLSAGDRAGP
ncbi:MAG TPA: ATP-binding protein, partial [Planctomycetaceae bacterium]|nr:ATP-binding protein [Planctomycetaceae bacterium]